MAENTKFWLLELGGTEVLQLFDAANGASSDPIREVDFSSVTPGGGTLQCARALRDGTLLYQYNTEANPKIFTQTPTLVETISGTAPDNVALPKTICAAGDLIFWAEDGGFSANTWHLLDRSTGIETTATATGRNEGGVFASADLEPNGEFFYYLINNNDAADPQIIVKYSTDDFSVIAQNDFTGSFGTTGTNTGLEHICIDKITGQLWGITYNNLVTRIDFDAGTLEDPTTTGLSLPAGSNLAYSVAAGYAIDDTLKRVRSNVQEDAGSILDSVDLNAVDGSYSEAFLLDTDLATGTIHAFAEALTPNDITALFYPLPRQTTEYLNDYAGETILSRMARTYPPSVFGGAAEVFGGTLDTYVPTDGEGNALEAHATAQEIITGMFVYWAELYDWFTVGTIPDLRLLVPSPDNPGNATPSEYSTEPELGRVGSPVISFAQDDDNRRTMRDILDNLLSPFPGTVVRVSELNDLVIVPAYGPDADASPVRTLTEKDAYSITTGQPNPKGIINRVTVRSTPWTVAEDAGALEQSWAQFAAYGVPDTGLYTTGTGDDISAPDPYPSGWNGTALWRPQTDVYPDQSGLIKLTDSGGTKQVTVDYKWFTNGSLASSGTVADSGVALTDIPTDGDWVDDAIVVTLFIGLETARLNLDARYVASVNGVELRVGDAYMTTNCFTLPCTDFLFRVNLLDATDAWTRGSKVITGTYGYNSEDRIAGVGGVNVLETSAATYGERERVVELRGYAITDGELLQDVAQAYVRQQISPTVIRQVDQSAWRAFPIRPDDLGRLVALPGGEEGKVISRQYTDDFGSAYGDGNIACIAQVELIDSTADGAVDLTSDYLLFDNYDYFVLDDGSFAEGS